MKFSVAWDLPLAYRGGSYRFATGAIPDGYLDSETPGVRFQAECDDGSTVDMNVLIRGWDFGSRTRYPDNPEKWIGGGYLVIKGVSKSFECTFSADADSLRRDIDALVVRIRASANAGKSSDVRIVDGRGV